VIVRYWSGRVPVVHASDFRRHLMATGVSDYQAQQGLIDVALWRRDSGGSAMFTLVSTWRDMESIHAFAGSDPTCAVLYPGDQAFQLIPDTFVTHHELIERLPCKLA